MRVITHNHNGNSIYRIGPFTTSKREWKELGKAWIMLSFAFAVVMVGGWKGISMNLSFAQSFLVSALTVGAGFILHEMSHKIVAQHYGCSAEFKAFDNMLAFAVLLALFFAAILAAPGAVFIRGPVGVKRNGAISAAGILANITLAFLFLILLYLFPLGILGMIGSFGVMINAWLALFNLIPIWNFDGKKVLAWDKKIYALLVISGAGLLILKAMV